MKIITTHIYADLDALSSMVMVRKLHPDGILVFPGNISDNVKKFITLYQDYLKVVKVKDIDFRKIEELIVVDTAKKNRIGRFAEILDDIKNVEIYDHHPVDSNDIEGKIYRRAYGSNTTHIIEVLKERLGEDIDFEGYELNIALMGIYEDTGSFSYSNTKPKDLEVASMLLSKGGNLREVHEYTSKGIKEEQKDLFIELLENSEVLEFSVERVLVTRCYTKEFITGLDEIINKIKELEECTACFIVSGNDVRTNIIARSSSIGVRLDEILDEFQGGGHWNAFSAYTKDIEFNELYDRLKVLIMNKIKKGKLARDIMATPVKTIQKETRLKDAYKLMKKYGYAGLPIVCEDILEGVISRRDVDKAISHGFANAPVRVYMSTNIISANEETSIEEIKRILVENEIGRVPILRDKNLVGIVTRADVLRSLFEQRKKVDKNLKKDSVVLRKKIIRNIPEKLKNILDKIRVTSKKMDAKVYLVGGIVRDIILGIPNEDIDIVVEGDGIKFARLLLKEVDGLKVVEHEKFKTAVVVVDDELKIDVATSRVEYYEYPTSLPTVEHGSLREDMYRRDFTINSLALEVDDEHFSELVDFFSGHKDILEKKIRILHNLSFIEDPTRIIRAFRFASRYNFQIERETERLIEDSVENGYLRMVSWPRVKNELKIILGDKNPHKALEYLEKYGVLRTIHPKIRYNGNMKNQIRESRNIDKILKHMKVSKWTANFLVLLEDLNTEELSLVFNKFGFSENFKKRFNLGIKKRKKIREELSRARNRSEIYDILEGITEEIVVLLYLEGNSELKKNISDYIEIKDVKPLVTGKDLIEFGLKPNEEFKEILKEVYYLQLDNKDLDRERLVLETKKIIN